MKNYYWAAVVVLGVVLVAGYNAPPDVKTPTPKVVAASEQMSESDAAPKCATAVDGYLRDPASAQYQWEQRAVSGSGDNWTVILPVRARNSFGVYITETFICAIKGSHVVEVER